MSVITTAPDWHSHGTLSDRSASEDAIDHRAANDGEPVHPVLAEAGRAAALFQLATDLPAAVIARMLGIHIAVAVAGQRAAAGDWAAYAAEVSRRPRAGNAP